MSENNKERQFWCWFRLFGNRLLFLSNWLLRFGNKNVFFIAFVQFTFDLNNSCWKTNFHSLLILLNFVHLSSSQLRISNRLESNILLLKKLPKTPNPNQKIVIPIAYRGATLLFTIAVFRYRQFRSKVPSELVVAKSIKGFEGKKLSSDKNWFLIVNSLNIKLKKIARAC